MNDMPSSPIPRGQRIRLPHHLRELLYRMLFQTHQGSTRQEFLREAAEILLEFSACDMLEVRIEEGGRIQRCRAQVANGGEVAFDCKAPASGTAGPAPPGSEEAATLDHILSAILKGNFAAAAPFLTRSGSFWTGDTARPILLHSTEVEGGGASTVLIGGEFQSVAIIPFPVTGRAAGVLQLASRRREFFTRDDVSFYEVVAVTLGVAVAHQAAQWALRERVKELTCLYGVAKATQPLDRPLELLLGEVVDLLPPGWQYPEITSARITLDGRSYQTANYSESQFRQVADILVKGECRGSVEVLYAEPRPALDEGPFLKEERNLINAVAESLGVMLSYQTAQVALRERVKELTCLHGIAKLSQRSEITLSDLLQGIAETIPPGLLYPELAGARITLDGREHTTEGFFDEYFRLSSIILVNGQQRGLVEAAYSRDLPAIDEGPFLKEERSLIDEVARQIGLIIERREAEEEKTRLQQQLRHADRLATIGQLAAGAAHELNEPLGSILGFAELAKNQPRLPRQARADLDKIIDSALHAREVIKKLMIFARQMPTHKAPVNLNELVEKGLLFLESRCAREGIKLVRQLAGDLPLITGDASQLHQVLVNLVVNAIQAMPNGGILTIETVPEEAEVLLSVQDTGTGMSEDVLKQIFVPFFTTKQVGQGTGLGLAVVHGIVTSHGGTIHVESEVGQGTRFEVRLPCDDSARENN